MEEDVQRREHRARVGHLERSAQLADECAKLGRFKLPTPVGQWADLPQHVFLFGPKDGRVALVALVCKHTAHSLVVDFTHHDGHTGLDDTRLFGSDLRERVAEVLRVVEADVGDDAEDGRDDVRAVQTAAEACLDDGDVHLAAAEIVEGHGRGQLEEGGLQAVDEVCVFGHEVHHALLRDGLAVDADALAEVD